MKRHRVGFVALFGALVLAVLAQPAAAQTSASRTSELIWGLNMNLLYVAIPITVLVEGILIYTVWRFSKNEDPLPTMENRRLEITWTIATAIILLFVGVASYQVLAEPMVTAQSTQQLESNEEPVTIEVVAQKYFWTFNYNGTAANTSQAYSADNRLSMTGTMVIPADRTVRLSVTSKDWLHAFHAPGLGLKQDAMPGQHNTIQTTVNEPGTYQLYCAEYCGSGHSQMLGQIRVLPEDEYQDWVDEQQSS
jgi:cytochrome c oxidase subunit 2